MNTITARIQFFDLERWCEQFEEWCGLQDIDIDKLQITWEWFSKYVTCDYITITVQTDDSDQASLLGLWM